MTRGMTRGRDFSDKFVENLVKRDHCFKETFEKSQIARD